MEFQNSNRLYCKKLKFNDNTELILEENSIVVFTGANNCGKSQILKDIEMCMHGPNRSGVIVKEYEGIASGRRPNEEQSNNYIINHKNIFECTIDSESKEQLKEIHHLREMTFEDEFIKGKINRLSTEHRLMSANPLNRNHNPQENPIYKLQLDELLEQKISDQFNQAFNIDLVLNMDEMGTIPLHVGKAPNKFDYTIDKRKAYYNEVKKLPMLHKQGDGMRSFAGILLNSFTTNYCINLIDEPEAFLHPPQARILGKMLVENNSKQQQLFISTHSEDFLQGLLDTKYDNLTVIRINRENNVNRMSILKNEEIKKLWKNPIMRYTNILSGLFHEKVVVCESDYDCLFYHALINAICETKNEIAPDILFVHCGGKGRMKDIVSALKAVNVPVVSICDFDLINDSRTFKDLSSSFRIDWESALKDDMKIIYDGMNARNSKDYDAWKRIKKIGKAGLEGEEPAAYEKIEAVCRHAGLFVVSVGELECFDKTVSKEKKEWVYHMLETCDLATYPKLEGARNFISEVLAF